MSVGFLLKNAASDAIVWRGPKKNGALRIAAVRHASPRTGSRLTQPHLLHCTPPMRLQDLIKKFLKDVDWGDLDYLLIDTPPGTSDEHISLAQYLKACQPDGCVIVTTPQEVALLDVRREINFCRKVNLPILGIVENMSGFVCPKCTVGAVARVEHPTPPPPPPKRVAQPACYPRTPSDAKRDLPGNHGRRREAGRRLWRALFGQTAHRPSHRCVSLRPRASPPLLGLRAVGSPIACHLPGLAYDSSLL